jgi:uncharacterized protein YutE (UPF0331/DUF86 family)
MDTKKTNKYINYITENLKLLQKFIIKYENGTEDYDIIISAIYRKAEEIVETAIKINNEILLSQNIISDSYFESFTNLKKINLLNEKKLLALAKTAGFRNRLAHEYMDLNENLAIDAIKKILKNYPEYLEKLINYTIKN